MYVTGSHWCKLIMIFRDDSQKIVEVTAANTLTKKKCKQMFIK